MEVTAHGLSWTGLPNQKLPDPRVFWIMRTHDPSYSHIHIPALEHCTDLSRADTSDRHNYFPFYGLAEEESSFLASFG